MPQANVRRPLRGRVRALLLVLSALTFDRAVAFGGHRAVVMTAAAVPTTTTKTATPTATICTPSSVYVNLPFCRRRCFYCDFPIKVVGDRPGAASEAAKPYVDQLVQEIKTTAAELAPLFHGDVDNKSTNRLSTADSVLCIDATDSETKPQRGVNTLFFGGGTPSLCPPDLVEVLIDTVRDCFGIADGAEISMEMDPGTFDEERLSQFLEVGVNRVSMGVQSFDAELLKSCGRAHSLQDVYDAVELIQRAGVENFSIDLMSGLPNQTLEQWEKTLSEATSTGAAHISVYDLQVEAGTAFGRSYSPGTAPLPQDETCAEMYRTASRVLRAVGYEHYEISNYARPGFHSRHNRAYWDNVPFLAFGNGAASYVDGNRFSRPRGLHEYSRWVDSLAKEGWVKATGTKQALFTGGKLSTVNLSDDDEEVLRAVKDQDRLLDDVMLGFRLKEGLDLDVLAAKYGRLAADTVEAGATEGIQRGWVELIPASEDISLQRNRDLRSVTATSGLSGRETHAGGSQEVKEGGSGFREGGGGGSRREGRRLRLSDPDGFLFSNSVISSVFCDLEEMRAQQTSSVNSSHQAAQ